MRLWGKIVSGGMFVMAAVLVIVAAMMPEERWKFATAAVALTVAAIYGVPVIVRLFMSLSGDEEVLETGIVGSATVTSLKETWWRFNDCPVIRFSLNVEAGGAAYPVEVKQAVDPELLEQLAPGVVLGVRVDRSNHNKVVIDWREPALKRLESPPHCQPVRSGPIRRSACKQITLAFSPVGLSPFRSDISPPELRRRLYRKRRCNRSRHCA